MGGPRDHWKTDIFRWNLTVFGEPVDSLIRDIQRYGGGKHLDDGAALARDLDLLSWPPPKPEDPAIVEMAGRLQVIRDRLRKDAIDRGWEVD